MTKSPLPTPDQLRQLLRYDPASGVIYWRERGREWFRSDKRWKCWNKRWADKPAFRRWSSGYQVGRVLGAVLLGHRVAWLLHHGEWPADQIDHINGDRSDNRLRNLRDVSHGANQRNKRLYRNNKSGVPGVRWLANVKRWQVRMKSSYLGRFKTFEEAVAARKAWEENCGYHPNHGRPVELTPA